MNKLGFDKAPADTRVVVAMSGGVDSSVVAALLAADGFDVVGITLQLYDHGTAVGKSKACCAGQDIHDARRVADRLGIPHYVLDYESRFRHDVMDQFAESYLRGETPIPCVQCNQKVKFRDLLETARDIGADCLATGHYVRRTVEPDGAALWRAVDGDRDQSYFLFSMTRSQLDFVRFPLGDLTKPAARAEAARFALPVASKPDSQDICFVPKGSYADVVAKLRPDADTAGDVVHVDGRTLGRHNGIVRYTIGQRRGLGIGGRAGEPEQPLYVVAIDAGRNRVIVGPKPALARGALALRDVNWLGAVAPGPDGRALTVMVRSTQPAVPARLWIDRTTGGALDRQPGRIVFDQPQYGVAPGQACVFYDGDRVLGGGWIARTEIVADGAMSQDRHFATAATAC